MAHCNTLVELLPIQLSGKEWIIIIKKKINLQN